MNFKQFLEKHNFIYIKGSFTHRTYFNGVYDIVVNNLTKQATLYRQHSNQPISSCHIDKEIDDCLMVY